jgi:hypothetical protein
VLYECENSEIAKYIVAKIKTSIILCQDYNNQFLKKLKEWLINFIKFLSNINLNNDILFLFHSNNYFIN